MDIVRKCRPSIELYMMSNVCVPATFFHVCDASDMFLLDRTEGLNDCSFLIPSF